MKRRSELMLLAAAMIWGGGFVAGKLALDTLSPFAVLAWRFGLAAVLCGILFRGRIRHAPRKVIRSGLLIGSIQIAALALQLTGLKYTTSAKQSFLCTAYVALTPFISLIVLRHRLTLRAVVAGLISLTGIGCICLNEAFTVNIGDALSLGFSVLFGLQVVVTGQIVSGDTDSVQISFYQFASAGLTSLTIALLRGDDLLTFSLRSAEGVLYLAVLNTLVAFMLQNLAQKYLPDTTASLIISLESVFGFLFSVLFFRELLTWRLFAGGALCFGAILLSSAGRRRKGST